jgi:predicted transposase YbfD/YdcC
MESNTEEGCVIDLGSLYAEMSQLTDNRDARGMRYHLVNILIFMVIAKLCGEDKPSGIAEWVAYRVDLLTAALQIERKSAPHHSTYRRILSDVVDVDELETVTAEYLVGKRYFGRQVVVAIDGKVLRGTVNDDQPGLHLLAAYLPEEGLVLMEMEVESHENEIPVAPKVLQCIDLRGKVVIGDAIHTQRNISVQIVASGGDYSWFAKGNQPQIEEDIRLWFEPDIHPIPGMGCPPKDFETATTINKGHGRLEKRTITVSSQMNDFLDWPYLEQVFQLERRFTILKSKEVQSHVVYGFTSMTRDQVSPARLLEMIRSYWRIENCLHYRRDVTLLEDRTRMTCKRAARALACINNLILGMLAKHQRFPFAPSARRYFNAFPMEAINLVIRL